MTATPSLVISTPHLADEVLGRLRAGATPELPIVFWPLGDGTRPFRGSVSERQFALRLHGPLRSAFSPIFEGRVDPMPVGSQLSGSFRPQVWTLIGTPICLLAALLQVYVALRAGHWSESANSALVLLGGGAIIGGGMWLGWHETRAFSEALRRAVDGTITVAV